MAKKKRKKRRSDRPAARAPGGTSPRATGAAERPVSARAERKEQARRERERRIRQAKRRRRMRRGARWGAVLGVGAAIAVVAYVQVQEGQELERRAEEAAGRLGCSAIETRQDEVDAAAALSQAQIHSPPFAQGTDGEPATAGRHSSPLPGDPHVYDQPIPEANAVHNLEHGYILVYYAKSGDHPLVDDIRSALENLARDETKVIMAPYPDLSTPLDLVAWGKLQTCDPDAGANPEDAVTVARGFIEQFRAGGLAPEPNGV
jgi:uncharacterized protein DUF3105